MCKKLNKIFLIIFSVTSVSQISSQSAVEYFNSGMEKYNQKKFELAVNDFDTCLFIDSSAYPAHLFRGLAEQSLGKHQEAILDFSDAVKYAPLSDSILLIYLYRAASKNALNDYKGALADLNFALNKNPEDTTILLVRASQNLIMKNLNQAAEDFSKLIIMKSSKADVYCGRAIANFQLNKQDNAFKDLAEAIRVDSTYPEAYKNRAEINYLLKNYEESLYDIKAAIIYSPNDSHLFCIKGSAEYELGKISEAISDLNRVIAAGPNMDLSHAFFTRGKCYLSIGNKENACEDFLRAKELGCSEAASFHNENCK